jgi:superfamily II DNA or RNA helicase
MGSVYDNLIKPTTMRELINQGWLSDYEFYAPTKPDMSQAKTSNLAAFGQDFKDKDAFEAMDKPQVYGDIVSNWLENGENRQTIAFCVNVAHANQLTVDFNKAGVQAEVVTAKTKDAERREIFKRFEEGITKIICNVGVLVAGFDQDVRCIIYARPTKSEIRWIQCIGRGLRTAEGKDKCIIFDHSGTVMNLGYPDDIEYESLINKDDGLDENQRTKQEIEKTEKLPHECPSCHFMKPAGSPPKCPRCGFMPLSGEEVPTDKKAKLQKLNRKLEGSEQTATMEEKQKFYSELKGYQRERRAQGKVIKDGWCDHKYRSKYGVWPKNIDKRQVRPVSLDTRNWLKHEFIKFSKSKAR